jgi:fucose 4-O-acetylase-like acetyltransferase
MKKRDIFCDILKGLGIITVVLGHCGTYSIVAICLNYWHMGLFFFISGLLYKEEYSHNPYIYIGKNLKNLYIPMAKYIILFILLHNLFLKINIYSILKNMPDIYPTVKYSLYDTLNYIFSTIFQASYPNELVGAIWFVLPLIASMSIFCFIKYYCLKFNENEILLFFTVLFLGIIGVLFSKCNWKFSWRVDIALYSLPLVYMGNFLQRHKTLFNKLLSIKYFVISIVVIIFLMIKGHRISYVNAVLGNIFYFYSGIFSGIIINIYFTKIILKFFNKKLINLLSILGKNSFNIMTLHFLAFKVSNLIDVIYNKRPFYMISKYPFSNNKLWVLNLIVGISFPVIFVNIYKTFMRYFNKKILKIYFVEKK